MTTDPERKRWTRIALWLVAGTMVYNVAEAVLAVWGGVEADSIALLGFGLDSIIEVVAAGAMLWRLAIEARGDDRERVEATERRVHQVVGATFLALALYVIAQAGWNLWAARPPEETVLGLVIAGASLTIMPLVSLAKLRAASRLGSGALRAEAKETLACSYLSFTLLLGLLAYRLAGWWWADSLAALLMVPWLIREGLEGLRGEECEDECEDE